MATEMLTANEVAKLLRVRLATVRQWARSGVIPRVRINAKVTRYDLAEVVNALKGRAMRGEVRLSADVLPIVQANEPPPRSGNEPPALLFSKRDLARELRTSVKTIDRMDAAGKLPRAVRIGRAKRWARQTIVEWIAAGAPDRETWERFHKRK